MGREAGEVLEYVSRIEGENLDDYVEKVSESLDRALGFIDSGMAEMLDTETTASMSAEDVKDAGGMDYDEANDLRAEYDGEIFVGNDVLPADPFLYRKLKEIIQGVDDPATLAYKIEKERKEEENRLEDMKPLPEADDQVEGWTKRIRREEPLLEEPVIILDNSLGEGGVGDGYSVRETRLSVGNRIDMIIENYFMPNEEYIGDMEEGETQREVEVPDFRNI